ncbi:DUF1330 domain-containing protein [Yinghuangia soli]|uniref:DUF1330 domain-containing protein n=1 Tax=Yinghuangia soli TaxID=2908204 RepID=A0AA41Q7G4_9ACTN|nr:DUF1330 domain-containing protein [Yinghuangia soli]MCF2532642.1 DUF1330 domain-containing protein [Yinghuangia soli]
MTAYAFAHLRSVDVNAEIVEYLKKIDATLPEFGGRFLVHNRVPEVVDGTFEGVLVIIEFPSTDAVKAWYHSPGYQEIVDLRINNTDGGAAFVEGVGPDYKAAALAADIEAAAAAAAASAAAAE